MPMSPHFSVSAPRQMAQNLDRPSTGASNGDTPEHSVHVRSRSAAHPQSPKRLSVFSGRSRSNTTTSSSASAYSSRRPPSSMTSNDSAAFSSVYEDRTGPANVPRHDRHESATKSLLQRGSRILRRQGSKVNMISTQEEEEEMERERSRFSRRKSRPSDTHEQMKRMISDPFDFHHLTHTSQARFQALGKTRENELVTEFSAIRASQKPVANLKGIRADDINMRSFSEEDLTYCVNEQNNDGPSPASPPHSPGARSTSPRQLEYRPLRESRIFENFSRPVQRYPRGDAPPPPRASSPRLASSPEIPEPSPRVIDEILDLDFRQPNPEYVYFVDEDSTRHSSPVSPKATSGVGSSSLGHAITTDPGVESMDARAVTSLNSPTSDLEDVPEEEDATHWHDSPQSQPSEYPASLDTQVSPKTNVPQKNYMSIHVAKELSRKFSEALGSPTLPQHLVERASMSTEERVSQSSLRRQSSIQQNTIHETIYESWEDDIDYCYEHAAESNSDFDWARTSFDESRKQGVGLAVTGSNFTAFSAQRPGPPTNRRYLSASALSTHDLDPSPPQPVPSSRSALTPSNAGYEGEMRNQKDDEFFQPVSSSMLSAALTKHISPDSLYEDYLAADGESDRHFSFCSQGGCQSIEHPVSPRSSFSPISKYNSQESLILSRAASVVRKHRSSVSTTSVPELVHSLASSRDFSTSDLMLPGDQTELARQDSSSNSSHHRHTKSLAREIENQLMSRPDSNGSMDSNKLMGATIHDRAKSTSEVEAAPLINKAIRPELPAKSVQRKKSRTPSYSLFPTPPTSTITHH